MIKIEKRNKKTLGGQKLTDRGQQEKKIGTAGKNSGQNFLTAWANTLDGRQNNVSHFALNEYMTEMSERT